MIPAVRHQAIVSRLRTLGGLSVGELADELGVSASTVRRDLSRMDHEGVVRRTYGGAVIADGLDEPLGEVAQENQGAKQRIADAAAGLIRDGMTVLIDVGSTSLALAERLRGRGLTIATPSLPAFQALTDDKDTQLFMLGGLYQSGYQCMTGPMTVEGLSQIRADIAVLGCSGISGEAMIWDTTLEQIPVKRAMMQVASKTVLLADSAKFPGKGSHAVGSLTTVACLVTDLADLGDLSDVLKPAGTQVIHV